MIRVAEKEMTWLEYLGLRRYTNASNVFLIETDDPKRLIQIRKSADKVFSTDDENPIDNIYHLDLQIGRIETLKGEEPPRTAVGPQALRWLLEKSKETPTVTIISWAVTRDHVNRLLDPLLHAAQHPLFYRPKKSLLQGGNSSSIVVFTFSLSLWPAEALRFFVTVEVPPSSEEERRREIELVVNLAKKKGYKVEVKMDEAIAGSAGLTLHDIDTAVIEAIRLQKPIDLQAFKEYKVRLLRQYGLEYVQPSRGFESVGGYDYVKEFLRDNIIIFYREPDLSVRYGLPAPRGILLFGPPGTGKSWLAKALAKEMGLPMVKLSAADLLRGIVGESEQRTRKITRLIESMAPIVVFIDEADQLFQSRSAVLSTDSGVARRVQNLLLDWLGDEDRKSFVVMATNYLNQFDFASVRAGRIDYAIPIMLPDKQARKEILKLHLEVLMKPQVPVELSDRDYELVATVTAGYTGAELAQLAKQAKLAAARERADAITLEHVQSALRKVTVRLEKRVELVRRMLEEASAVETVIVPQELLMRAREGLRELQAGGEQDELVPF